MSNKARASCGLWLTSVICAMQTRQLLYMLVIACKYDNCFFTSDSVPFAALQGLFIMIPVYMYMAVYIADLFSIKTKMCNMRIDVINNYSLWGWWDFFFSKRPCVNKSFILGPVFPPMMLYCDWSHCAPSCEYIYIFFPHCAWRKRKQCLQIEHADKNQTIWAILVSYPCVPTSWSSRADWNR